ncbi:MAG TPA: redoxin family protein [Planctomycetota bacterium]|nr:redoxin family protein [Planctomycetota bacterium]
MKATATLLAAAALLAGCSAEPEPVATAPAGGGDPLPSIQNTPGVPPPDFKLPSITAPGEISLVDSLRAASGKPLVIVLGSASCSFSTQEVNELAASKPGYAIVCVVQGQEAEVRKSLPKFVPFPVLLDLDGATLQAYGVKSTPSVVVLDDRGHIAYKGDGGYIPPKTVAEMAAKVARGEPVGVVQTEGG